MKLIAISIITFSILIVIWQVNVCFACDIDYCSDYRDSVVKILDEENLNRDYYYLMSAESRCRKGAVSHKGAVGFWQLMPYTGKYYGCSNLNDLECATRAASKYIKHLQTMFSSFDDVIIAYNMGGHNYLRLKKPSKEASGLLSKVKRLKCNG